MNKTKRKIFETSMKLFAEKGYDATSIEEITSVVGVAKGTLYYHFSSKEELFYFLVEEGMKLLKNSIEIKTSKTENTIEKLKAVSVIQLKVIYKYENIITIVLSQMFGTGNRNVFCKDKVIEYINVIQDIIEEGLEIGDIKECNSELMASQIFSLTCSSLIFSRKIKEELNKELNVKELEKEYEKDFLNFLAK